MSRIRAAAVFFDVDFTLIYPGPTFQGEGYARFCERYGMTIDAEKFDEAVRAASSVLDAAQDHVYDADIFVCYTKRIIEEMGGEGPRLSHQVLGVAGQPAQPRAGLRGAGPARARMISRVRR